MRSYSTLPLVSAKRQARLFAHIRRFHLRETPRQECPGCTLERAIEQQLREATC